MADGFKLVLAPYFFIPCLQYGFSHVGISDEKKWSQNFFPTSHYEEEKVRKGKKKLLTSKIPLNISMYKSFLELNDLLENCVEKAASF